MKIITGKWRGRKLVAPKGLGTRPTAARTRETLFNMLTSRLGSFDSLRAADLFAGSGALGLEALSRGAASCLFVEHDRAAITALRGNITALEAHNITTVEPISVMHLGPVEKFLPAPPDLILLDPPYNTSAAAVALDRLLRLGWIHAGCWIACESAANEAVEVKGLTIEAERKVGKALLTLMRRAP